MFSIFSKTVFVSFVDCSTGAQFAASKMPPAQLPDTFALDTEFDIAGSHYIVVRAEPETKAEFVKAKRLTLTLRKVELIDPRKILFSLPTICNAALPAWVMVAVPGYVHELHEDDWRQCEFVGSIQQAVISAELASVRRIQAEAAVDAGGWREIHVRERISVPLPAGIKWDAITAGLGGFEAIGGIAFGDLTKPVVGAIAVRHPSGVIVWGVEVEGELTALCVEEISGADGTAVAGLKCIADNFSLVVVDWCRCRAYSPGPGTIEYSVGVPWDSGADQGTGG